MIVAYIAIEFRPETFAADLQDASREILEEYRVQGNHANLITDLPSGRTLDFQLAEEDGVYLANLLNREAT